MRILAVDAYNQKIIITYKYRLFSSLNRNCISNYSNNIQVKKVKEAGNLFKDQNANRIWKMRKKLTTMKKMIKEQEKKLEKSCQQNVYDAWRSVIWNYETSEKHYRERKKYIKTQCFQ